MPRADRVKLLLLLGFFATPAMAAWLTHLFWRPATTANYGELMQPEVPRLPGLADAKGIPADLATLRGRWILLTVATADCDAACGGQLDLSRRVRLAQGRDQNRIVQALVQSAPLRIEPPAGLHSFQVPHGALAHWPGSARTYLIDPMGRLMMRFPEAADGQAMARDLRQLLKASGTG